MKLTPKQRLFADEYVESGNATQSAIKAGYATKSARFIGAENITKSNIKAYIERKMSEIESNKIATAKEALQGITAIARGETTETQVAMNPITGKWEKTEVAADLKTRLSAWKEILKRYPLASDLTKAQCRKAKAEAEIAETQVKVLKQQEEDSTQTVVVDDIKKVQELMAKNDSSDSQDKPAD